MAGYRTHCCQGFSDHLEKLVDHARHTILDLMVLGGAVHVGGGRHQLVCLVHTQLIHALQLHVGSKALQQEDQ